MFIFDGPNKRIHMDPAFSVNGVFSFSVQQLWSRWVDWQAENKQYPFAFSIIMVPKPDGGFIGPYMFLRNDLGWRGVPPPIDGCTIQITSGSFYGMSGSLPVMVNLPGQETDLVIVQADIVNTVVTSGTPAPTANEVAAAVWAHSSGAMVVARLAEAWGRLGLDPSTPLVTGQTSITFGDVVMALTGDATSTTVTRQ
jgi:hypothetical protein